MPTRFLLLLGALAVLMAGVPSRAEAPATAPGFKLIDQKAVRKVYTDGELDKALSTLEEFQRTADAFPREDSLFLYKYLGVIYSHNKDTREKGQTYFFKLLRMDPKASIVDMYASSTVKDVFDDAREEVEASAFLGSTFKPLNQGAAPNPGPSAAKPAADSAPAASTAAASPKPKPARPAAPAEAADEATGDFGSPAAGKTWIYAGVAAVAAVGAAVGFHYFFDEPPSKDKILKMDDQ